MAPKQKPGRSKQNYGTPAAFIRAVKRRLEIDYFDCDLAADEHNAKADTFLTKEDDALSAPTWKLDSGWNWLNPPFAHIDPWAAKAFEEMTLHEVRTAMLIPAGVGSNWWRDHVHGKALALLLNGRLIFDGTPINPKTGKPDAYPKDCALLLYSREDYDAIQKNGDWPYDVWEWKKDAGE